MSVVKLSGGLIKFRWEPVCTSRQPVANEVTVRANLVGRKQDVHAGKEHSPPERT